MEGREYLKRLWVLMATVFVDMMGFLIVLPLLPFYAERHGASPSQVGLLVASFAFAQLATAPLWGRLSDRYGRRPMILAGLVISAVSYMLFEVAGSVPLLLASRLVQGAGAGTTGVVQAYLSDSVPSRDRAKALGWLTAATSAGVMVGPALGSLAAALGWIGPGYLAASLCVLNLLFAWRWLPESAAPASGRKPTAAGSTRAIAREVIRRPSGPVGSLVWIYALGMMAFMGMNGVLALYLERVFGVTEQTIGWFYVFVGAASLIMRSLVLGPAVRKFGEGGVLRLGLVAMALGMATLPLARNLPELALAIVLVPIGTALLFPATTSMVSQRAPDGRTGLVLGVQQGFGGVSRMIGPMATGVVFETIGIRAPFYGAAVLLILVRVFAGRVVPRGHTELEEVEAPAEPTEAISAGPGQ